MMGFSAAVSIPRRVAVALLAAFYLIAFVLSPYWRLIRPEFLAIVVVVVIVGLGAVWSHQSAGKTGITIEGKSWLTLGALFLGVVILNLRALTSVIPWRGDESGHIEVTRELVKAVPVQFALLVPLLLVFLVLAVARKSRKMFLGGALLELVLLFLFYQTRYFDGLDLSRWPYVNYWLFAIAPLLSRFLWGSNHEILYRIIPLLSATTLAWILTRHLPHAGFPLNLLWGFAVATIPIVFYYSSVLYIEMPAVCLMTIVCFQAETLLRDDLDKIKQTSGWFALVLLGFIKETVIVFLLCFLFCRAAVSFQRLLREHPGKRPHVIMNYLRQELAVAFCVLYPLVLYLSLRAYEQLPRSFTPDMLRLVDPVTYKIIMRSFLEQFWVFFLFFLGGLSVLAWKRGYPSATFLLIVLIAGSLVFGIDSGGAFVGYSRFNLFVLPPVLAASAVLANWIGQWRRIAIAVMSCSAIALNLIMSPIYLDGTKVPLWGNYVTDTGEHYYPYDTALLYLKQNYPKTRMLFSGMYYQYPLRFYFAKYHWFPKYGVRFITGLELENETLALSGVLSEAKLDEFGLVLWQVKGPNLPQTSGDASSCLVHVFRNQAHILMLFSVRPKAGVPCEGPSTPAL